MLLTENELRDFLARNNVDCKSLRFLWEIGTAKVFGLTIVSGEAIDLWNHLRQLTDESQYYPLLLGGQEEIEQHQDSLEMFDDLIGEAAMQNPIARIFDSASKLDAELWFRDRAQDMYDDMCSFGDLLGEVEDGDPLEVVTNKILGEWKEDVSPNHRLTIPEQNPRETVTIALIPNQNCWYVPAYLNFGNWNNCPAPEEHICLMKRWHDFYGAEVISMTHDIVEMRINKPPQNRNDALALAKEQYLYCNDIVDQGTQTLKILADILVDGSVWFFWWD